MTDSLIEFRVTYIITVSTQLFVQQEDEADEPEVVQHRDNTILATGLVFELHELGINSQFIQLGKKCEGTYQNILDLTINEKSFVYDLTKHFISCSFWGLDYYEHIHFQPFNVTEESGLLPPNSYIFLPLNYISLENCMKPGSERK